VELASIFLYAGTFYSDVPYSKVAKVRAKKRQIGLGLMGVHEWLLKRGHKYGDEPAELKQWLDIYSKNLQAVEPFSTKMSEPVPAKGRAIAPTGTIGIIGETTTGCEPIFCVSYKRRYLKGDSWNYQYVIDPVAKRLIEQGMSENEIEDAYSISMEKRISFQAFLQDYVDMAISSTINMPKWGSEFNNSTTVDSFGKILMKYMPRLRGITVYPDGCRSGQPLVPVRYSTALRQAGTEFVEGAVDVCDITKGGSCGS
jgi:ribonucleoside-diphosphate reductase alpha chain